MSDFDALVGLNIASYRRARRWSQNELAEAMTNSGHTWHQQTVAKVEKGTRPLRLEEASDVAAVLTVKLEDITGGDARWREVVRCVEGLAVAARTVPSYGRDALLSLQRFHDAAGDRSPIDGADMADVLRTAERASRDLAEAVRRVNALIGELQRVEGGGVDGEHHEEA